jgi:hypothetical protein
MRMRETANGKTEVAYRDPPAETFSVMLRIGAGALVGLNCARNSRDG